MLSVADALALVLGQTHPLPAGYETLTPALLGRVLAEPIYADIDSPPYDKSMMDGYAVRCADCQSPPASLEIIEEIPAGATPTRRLGPGQSARILTGAPLPEGADAVVMQERTRREGSQVIVETTLSEGENILRRGVEIRTGDVVLEQGTILRPPEFGLLTAVGRTSALVHRIPRVSVLSTGDELVEANARPGPGQIRNSNGPMLAAQVARAGGQPRYLGIAPDERDQLRSLIREGLHDAEALILSGGVSVGTYDLVPEVLADLGVQAQFHRIALKPGKPLMFGTYGSTLVFGLPGNPVSSFVCFELFVRPAFAKMRGGGEPAPEPIRLPLAEAMSYRSDRPTYHPACIERAALGSTVRPVPWLGSADLRALARANALMVLPAGETTLAAGDAVPVIEWER